ncbi:MAG TPA: hypothetical protein VF260_12565 [Bacilli bacterium]
MHIAFAGNRASSWDEADFALAVERFDLLAMQPHFPGYPLFVFPAMLLNTLGYSPVSSLSFLSGLCGACSAVLLYLLVKRLAAKHCSIGLAVFCAVLFSLHPALFLTSIQPMSDAAGLMLALLMLWIAAFAVGETRERTLFAVLLLGIVCGGLLLGVRLSYFPLLSVLFFVLAKWLRCRAPARLKLLKLGAALFIGIGSIALWLLPMARTEGGLVQYFALGKAFTEGHFAEWGNTLAEQAQALPAIILWLKKQWVEVGIGGGYIAANFPRMTEYPFAWLHGIAAAAAVVVLLMAWLLPLFAPRARVRMFAKEANIVLALFALPYFLWVLFGQNLGKWRHLLPLYVILIVAVAVLLFRLRRIGKPLALACMLVFAILWAAQTAVTVAEFRAGQPVNRLSDYVREMSARQHVVIFTWEEKRVLDYEKSGAEAVMVKSWNVFAESVRLRQGTADKILVTNSVINGFAPEVRKKLMPHLRLLRTWRTNPLLAPDYDNLVLYELKDHKDKLDCIGYNSDVCD